MAGMDAHARSHREQRPGAGATGKCRYVRHRPEHTVALPAARAARGSLLRPPERAGGEPAGIRARGVRRLSSLWPARSRAPARQVHGLPTRARRGLQLSQKRVLSLVRCTAHGRRRGLSRRPRPAPRTDGRSCASDRHGWPLSHSPCASRHLHIHVQWRECKRIVGTILACLPRHSYVHVQHTWVVPSEKACLSS